MKRLILKMVPACAFALAAGCATEATKRPEAESAKAAPAEAAPVEKPAPAETPAPVEQAKPAAKENFGAKNVVEAKFMDVPEACETMLKTHPDDWNFSFRPYGNNSEQLWTDPTIKRSAVSGGSDFAGKHPTALNVTCNADGWTFLVFCVAPEIANSLAATNGLPVPSMEFFFAPGDQDNHKAEVHYHFYYGDGFFAHYPWSVDDRTWRNMEKNVRTDLRRTSNGYVARFTIPWFELFDKLPFTDKADNFWRLQVVRWVDGGVTFGGVAHQVSRAGYVKFPDFTAEQKAEIMVRLLEKALVDFRFLKISPVYNYAGGWYNPAPRGEKYFLEHAEKNPRTWTNYGDDPAFQPILKRLVDERLALEPTIAKFRTLPPDEQLAFYKKASDMLFNFRYDVEEAYAKHLQEKMFK